MEGQFLLLLLVSALGAVLAQECDKASLPVACFPKLEDDLVAGLRPVASNTCGLKGPERVCYQVGAGGMIGGTCDFCDANNTQLAHPAELMTDAHSPANPTFWQSQSYSFVQYPNTVSITFPFNKTYDIRSIAITFQSSRPESYAIYKSADYGASFTPFHYYSLSCNATFGVEEGTTVEVGREAVALCTSSEARLTPLSGGEAIFMPLEHRPSAAQLASNPQLQNWARATDLQLRLYRLNTFGDEIITSDSQVLDSYYYAISEVEVSGQCCCNGHASRCVEDANGALVCDCQHNTAGPDCGECRPFYQDRPWRPATTDNPAACAPCNCNNHSMECYLDAEVLAASGNASGGVCINCQHNTTGRACELCQVGFYSDPSVPFTSPGACLACDCDPRGTVGGESSCRSSVLSSSGQCSCKMNVQGRQCSECVDGFYGLELNNPNGCSACECVPAGTVNSSALCDKSTGQCSCLMGVAGRSCDHCIPGYYDLSPLRGSGCLECMCFVGGSVSAACDVTTGDCKCRSNIGGSGTDAEGREVLTCSTPLSGHFCPGLVLVYEAEGAEVAGVNIVQGSPGDRYTGSGFVRLGAGEGVAVSGMTFPFSGQYDISLRLGASGLGGSIRVVVMVMEPLPPLGSTPCTPLSRWEETLNLSSSSSSSSTTSSPFLTACLLSGLNYSVSLMALNSELLVDSVIAMPTLGEGAGQLDVFRLRPMLDLYLRLGCAQDHTTIVGNRQLTTLARTQCSQLTCSATFQLFGGALACDCDPIGSSGGSCDTYRGQCPCRPGFSGRRCDLCTPGRGGSQCEACNCSDVGALTTTCDRQGQCVCKPGVGGLTCNTCLTGYFNPTERGCDKCGCDLVGSEGVECDTFGRCACRDGVMGDKCKECDVGHSNLTTAGCRVCDCDSAGSLPPLLCDALSGSCLCRPNVLLPRCDRCNCSGNSDLCDLSTGVCSNCQRNTTGNSCERCLPGYYGNTAGQGCAPCPCPGTEPGSQFASSCEEVEGGGVKCVRCAEGHEGAMCERCALGYVGDPTGQKTGSPLPCISCNCNGNGDPSLPDLCYLATGVCVRCLNNTAGDGCEKCARGYHGDAITAKNCTLCPDRYYWLPNGTCAPCNCHPSGSVGGECEDESGRCSCRPSVLGLKCDVCGDNYHRIADGCVACPACYNLVATEFNHTLSLYSDLLLRINTSMVTNGNLPADLLQALTRYRITLRDLLQRTLNLTNQEKHLTDNVASVAAETDELAIVSSEYGVNVSLSEDRLRGLKNESALSSQLYQRLIERLTELERSILVELRSNLSQALSLEKALQREFNELVSLSTMADEVSFKQLQLALSLLANMQAAASNASEALRLLCEALSLQNKTTESILSLEQSQLPILEAQFRAAQSALAQAEVDVPRALSQARAVLDRALSLSIPDHNASVLRDRLQLLTDNKTALVSITTATNQEIDRVKEEVMSLRRVAGPLLNESRRLNGLAVELLARAHAARSFAGRTTQEGNAFITMVTDLLAELRRRLNETRVAVEGLEEVRRNVRRAEEEAEKAEEEGRREEELLREAAALASQAVEMMTEASNITEEAVQTSLRVNQEVRTLLNNAHILNNGSRELGAGVSGAAVRLGQLRGTAEADRRAISIVTTDGQQVLGAARVLQLELDQLSVTLEQLAKELNDTALVSSNRLMEVGSKVEQLEGQANSNQLTVDQLQKQVRLLEQSAAVLRDRHVSLQQHRDLLSSILKNIRRLNCQAQFQGLN